MTTSLYRQLVAIGAGIDNHESDLYVKWSPAVGKLVTESGLINSGFTSNIDGEVWIEVPFAYDPFWDSKAAKK